MKKILIVSVSVGNGHTRAAQALKKTAKLHFPNATVEHVDFVDFVNTASKKIFFDTYDIMVRNTPIIYRMLYDAADKKTGYKFLEKITTINKKLNTKKFKDFVLNFSPDALIFTHFVPAEIFNTFNDDNIFSATVITDYENHRLWFTGNKQKYFVAHDKIKKQLIELGCEEKSVIESGIPVDPDFFDHLDDVQKNELKNSFGIDATKKIIAIMPCGKGNINPVKLAKKILEDSNVLVFALSGHDLALQENYKKIDNKNLIVFGWSDQLSRYLQLADLVVTKPGGLAVSECSVLGKPMIFVNPIPGQEEKNVQYMTSIDAGTLLNDENDWLEILKKIEKLKPNNKQFNKQSAKIILENVLNNI